MKKRILSILLTLVMVIGMLPTVAHAAVGEIETITDEELLEVMEVYLRIGNEIIASYESTSFSKMSNPGHWELKLSKRDNANRMEYYIVLHLYNYNVPSGYIDFMYDMKSSADPMNSVSFQVSVHGDCQVGFISASTTDKERVYGSSLDIIFAAGATLRTKQINHRGTGQWGSDIELNLEGTPGEKPGILYTKEIANSYYFIDWPHGSEPVTYANNLIIINYDTPTNGTLFRLDEDKCTYKVQFGERVDLFLNTGHGQFPIFGEYADETLAQKYQYIEDDGITAFSDLRAHLWFKESGDPADEYTVGDSIDYYFFPELSMLDFLFKAGINEQFKGDTTSGFKVESSYELTNLSRSTKVASDTVVGAEEVYSYEKDNFVKVAGKNGEEYFTFETSGIYELRATVKLIHNGNVVDSVGKVYHFIVNDKPLVTPTITQQPESVTSATGDSVTLTATAENAERARWYVEKSDGTVAALGDAFTDGTSTQTISKADNAVGNRYFCAFWSVDNKIAKTDSVTVCFVPTVTSNGDVNVDSGNTAFLKVTENGCGHYAAANGWYKDGVELTSGDKYYIMGTTLAVQNAAAEDAGTYTYKYVTEHGDEVTANVTLTVNTGSSSTTIDTFDITGLDNPVILGTVADTSVSVPTGANYTVESVTWTAGVNGSGVVTGSSGMVSIKLKAKDGYTFKSGDLAGTVEGIYKTVYSVPANATEITVTVDYNNYSSWKIAYPANDTISISTDSLTFKAGTAANGQKVEGAFNCTHSGLADTNLHHTGMKYAVYSIADNAMPAGLTLNADGTITGTPTTAGVYTVMVRADSVNASGTASNCSGLAVKAIEIIVEDKDAHTHDWDIEHPEEVTPANCTTDGTSKITCKDTSCNESVEITVPATGHNWGEWNNGAPIITPRCTDANDLVIYRTCNNANCPVETESKTISRIHMAMDWTTDETHHWKVCGYCETEILVEKDAHKDTNSDNKCDTCEYDMTPAVQPTEYTITVNGGTASVGAGTAVTKATAGTEITLTVDESAIPAGKVFDKWEVVSGGVTITDGKFTMPANAVEINATYKDAPVVPTEYDITVTGGTASANKAVAGTVITLTVDESAIPAGKVFDKWEVVSGGVTVADGKFTMPESAVEINATYKDAPVSHTCDIKPVAKDEPSCTEGGKEAYYKCEGCGKFYEDALGAKEITDLANWGNLPKLGHTESDWKSDKDNHWKECTVTACGVIIEDSKAAHKDDNKDGKCDVCEYNVGVPSQPGDNPQTGDNSNMFLWIALLFISGAGVVATTVFGKKKFSVK